MDKLTGILNPKYNLIAELLSKGNLSGDLNYTDISINDEGGNGEDGFSPIITVKTSTPTEYILNIETKSDNFDTPNLKGKDGTNAEPGADVGIPEAPIDDRLYGRKNESWELVEVEKQFNWRGAFQFGNMYNKNDVVIASDGNDYIAIMDGLVLPPPSIGWDYFSGGSRDFVQNPIDLANEVIGILPIENLDLSNVNSQFEELSGRIDTLEANIGNIDNMLDIINGEVM